MYDLRGILSSLPKLTLRGLDAKKAARLFFLFLGILWFQVHSVVTV